MRDTNDMMEDAICEDTMMECSGDGGGLEDLVNLASDIADSAPSIRDAAERLLTLLGVDEDDDVSSSEDEGVEVDLEDSDSDEPQDTRLLHQLAASLAQELKYAKQNSSNCTKLAQSKNSIADNIYYGKDIGEVQSMDFAQDFNQQVTAQSIANFSKINLENNNPFVNHSSGFCYQNDADCSSNTKSCQSLQTQSHFPRHPPPPYQYKSNNSQFDNRSRIFNPEKTNQHFGLQSNFQNYQTQTTQEEQSEADVTPAYVSSLSQFNYRTKIEHLTEESRLIADPVSWGIGWDACASEALRYLVEDEGLPPHHPTVIAMKNHLDLQRSRVVSQFAS